jgi:tRNA A37 threonylcarbamoyladenosine modification protein TsaB
LGAIAARFEEEGVLIVPLQDARRENVYAGIYKRVCGELTVVEADQHIALVDLVEKLKTYNKPVIFCGVDAEKVVRTTIEQLPDNFKISDLDAPTGVSMQEVASEETLVENVLAFTPFYLRKVEAETKWLETHEEDPTAEYVSRN